VRIERELERLELLDSVPAIASPTIRGDVVFDPTAGRA